MQVISIKDNKCMKQHKSIINWQFKREKINLLIHNYHYIIQSINWEYHKNINKNINKVLILYSMH